MTIAVAPGDIGPAALGQDLHHDVLRVDKGLEVGVLVELVVAIIGIDDLFGGVEELHPDDAEDEEDEGEKMEKFNYYRHYLEESSKDALYVVDYWVIQAFEVGRLEDYADETCQSEETEHLHEVGPFGLSVYQEEKHTHHDHQGVQTIPTLCKKFLWTDTDDPHDEFHQEQPDEEGIEYLGQFWVCEDMKDRVDSADDNEYGHDGIEQPVFDNSLKS